MTRTVRSERSPGAVTPASGDRVVIAVGAPSGELAARHCAARRGRLHAVDEAAEAAEIIAGTRPSAVTLVGLADRFDAGTVQQLQQSLGAERDHRLPWGILTGRDLAQLGHVVRKQHLHSGNQWSRHLSMNPLDARTGPRRSGSGPLTTLYGAEITPAVLRTLTEVGHDLIAITSHGDQADAYAFGGYLCSRTASGYEDLLSSTRGLGLMRCFSEPQCYRGEASSLGDRIPPGEKALLPGGRLRASVVMLNSCASVLAAPGGRYHPAASLLLSCLEGSPVAVVASQTTRRGDACEPALLSALLWSGWQLGAATQTLNALQADYFSGSPAFVLFGDPDLELAGPPPSGADGAEWSVEERGDLRVRAPASGAQFSYLPMPSTMAGAVVDPRRHRVRVAVVDADDPAPRGFLVPRPDGGHSLVLISEQVPLPACSVQIAFDRDDGAPPSVPALRVLQRRLLELDALTAPLEQADALRLEAEIVRLLRAKHLPRASSTRAAEEQPAVARLLAALTLVQSKLVHGWVDDWSGSLAGEMISLRQDRLLYGPQRLGSRECPSCKLSLYEIGVAHEALADANRLLLVCPQCTVVADLPENSPMLVVDAAPHFERGAPYRVEVTIPNQDDEPIVAVAGAAVLGARGRCRPAIMQLEVEPGATRSVSLTIGSRQSMVPGVYNLRVVVVDNLRCRFHLRPVSVVLGPRPDEDLHTSARRGVDEAARSER